LDGLLSNGQVKFIGNNRTYKELTEELSQTYKTPYDVILGNEGVLLMVWKSKNAEENEEILDLLSYYCKKSGASMKNENLSKVSNISGQKERYFVVNLSESILFDLG
jgi:hypothetical protein